LRRFTGLRRMSRKRRALQRVRHAVIADLVVERGGRCEFPAFDPVVVEMTMWPPYIERVVELSEGRCIERAVDVHEIKTRARGGSIVDPANLLLACRPHHDWAHGHPREAAELGLLAHSWAASA
jgi:signal recognition particle subunit SEC65